MREREALDRKDIELAKRALKESGIDVERFDKLAAERAKERRGRLDGERRRAVDGSAAIADRLKDLVPIVLPLDPVETVIDQVTFIRGFAGQGRLVDWNVGPGDNWATYRLDSDDDSNDPSLPGRLSFFLLWRNPQSTPTVLMAKPNLKVNAHLSCDADGNGVGSWFGVTSQARATVRARTTVWNMDSTISSIVHDEVLGTAVARGNFWGDDSSRSIAFNEILSASGVAIAPDAYSLIEVEVLTEWQALHGSAVFDAESGTHRIDVPQIILTENRPPAPPPISVTAGVDTATTPATVTLIWTGANGTFVDIYQNGVRLGDTENDGTWSFPINAGTHTFRVCEKLSTVCSMEVTVTVP